MFGVHRQDLAAGAARRFQQGRTGADQAFLVGQGDGRAGAGGGQGGGQAGGADNGAHHPVRGPSGGLDHRLGPGGDLDAGSLETLPKPCKATLVLEDHHGRAPPQGLLNEPFDIAAGRQGDDFNFGAGLLQQVQGRHADRAGAAENGDSPGRGLHLGAGHADSPQR